MAPPDSFSAEHLQRLADAASQQSVGYGRGALTGSGQFAGQAKSAPIAETVARTEKVSALAQQVAARAASIVASLIGAAPEAAQADAQAAPDQSPVVVRRLNDQLTDAFTALNRIDAQLGRLAAALG